MALVPRLLAALMGLSAYTLPPANNNTLDLDSPSVEATRRILGGQLTPPPVAQTRWHQRDLESAELEADMGDLSQVGKLWNACKSDGVFMGVLSTRTEGIVGLPKRYRGFPQLVSELKAGGESVRSVFDEMFPPAELAAIASDGLGVGVGVGELVPVQGRAYPVLVRHSPEFLVYRWAENRWYLRTVAGLIAITPGDGRWILHIPGGRIAPWRNGIWKAIGSAWIRKQHALLYNGNWEAKLANPARVAQAPAGAPEAHEDAFLARVMAWGVNTVFGLKPGYEVKLIESNGRGWESFNKTIDRSEREYVICVAGQEVTTTGGTGFANADVHKSIRADLIKATADALAYTLNTQGIPVWVLNRYGEEMLEFSPCVEWIVTPPRDLVAEATALVQAGNAIERLRAVLLEAGEELDVADLAVRFGIPVKGDRDGDGKAETAQKIEKTRESSNDQRWAA